MVGIYFSGTGNTKFCIQKFVSFLGKDIKTISIEDKNALSEIKNNKNIILAYPIYYSNLPKIVSTFLVHNKNLFKGKRIFIIATMALFSGDGTGCSARLLKKFGANIIGGLHIKMPDCISDVKLLKYSFDKNKRIIELAAKKLKLGAKGYKNGIPPQEGLNSFYHIAGLLGQRLWFYNKTRNYTDKLKIDSSKCIGCNKCVLCCPMDNLNIVNHNATSQGKCTMCYRCINKCPQQAITLIGNKVVVQYTIDDYFKS